MSSVQSVPHQQEEVADVGEETVTEESVAEGEDISSTTEKPVQSRGQDAVSDSEQQFASEEVQQTEHTEEPVQTAEKKTVEKADASNPKTKSDDEVDEKARKERVTDAMFETLAKMDVPGIGEPVSDDNCQVTAPG